MKAHIGVDVRTGLTHAFTTTAANVHDLNEAHQLLHGEEKYIFADSGYRGAQKREELKTLVLIGTSQSSQVKLKNLRSILESIRRQ